MCILHILKYDIFIKRVNGINVTESQHSKWVPCAMLVFKSITSASILGIQKIRNEVIQNV